MSSLLLIWGAGGHGKVVLDVARDTKRFECIAFLDDGRAGVGLNFCECAVIGGPEQLPQNRHGSFVIAIGQNQTRARCFNVALGEGLNPETLVHRTAVVAPSASIGRGTVVMPGVIVNAGAVIGENCILNTGSIVEHDCRIADHTHLSPRAVLGGAVTVGAYAHIGIGATVLPCVAVGEGSVVGAGAVVLKNVPVDRTVAGVPAKILSGR